MASRHERSTSIGEYIPFHIFQKTVAGPADPSTQAAGAPAAGGSLPVGAFTITYSWLNANGQSVAAPTSAAITTVGGNLSILTTAVSPPGGCTVNWYIVSAPSGNVGLVGNNNGAAFSITASPAANAATPYAISTTAPRLALPQTAVQAAALGTTVLDYGHGVYLGLAILNTSGTNIVLNMYNGNTGTPVSQFASLTAGTNATLHYDCVLDQGLYYTYLGTTAGSITICVLPVPV